MRARWVIWITGGLLVLAVAFLFVRPRPERLLVAVYKTNDDPTSYVVAVANLANRPCLFMAWSEYETNGAWKLVEGVPQRPMTFLKPSEKDVFTLPRPDHGNRRIAVLYRRISDARWEYWYESLRAMVGIYSGPEHMYVDAP